MRFWLRIHFRRVFVNGTSHVPAKGPVILCCNHPNSFLDAISVALLLRRPVHFLVRSDVFRNPAARWILQKLKMIPIYRLQEGMENIEKNKGTFKLCNEILSRGEVLLIFSEGNCVMEKRLRPLKKGTARIAFGAAEFCDWKNEINIVPVGINYADPAKFRTELMISFGTKIEWIDLKDNWLKEQARAIKLFNDRLYPAIKDNMLIIPSTEMDDHGEDILRLGRNLFHYNAFRFYYHNASRLKREQQWLHKILSAENHNEAMQIHHFARATRKSGLTILSVDTKINYGDIFLLTMGFIPAIAGVLFHLIPALLAHKITIAKVRAEKFKSSVLFGTGSLLTYLWYIVLFISCFSWNISFLPFVLILPFLVWITLLWLEKLQRVKWIIQHRTLLKKNTDTYLQWKTEKERLLKNFY